ncbi:ATP-dependent DNA helicase RecQ [Halobacillus sp. A5]|uniref:RecQ family ATP-dependent DNA helicase n=1 Tax=Halobacillus sp. A5 TaxID=2880263 RepID=UPI0020A682BA|nr:ATP-dependent DNA helicase RecQ [Halobacillus sp. A5]MCP3025824.1 ATP-dependent DNA helicase [Halobacillus sp. A5]
MSREQLHEDLKRYFGYSEFRQGQQEIIEDVLEAKDVLGILPTGSGKSLCFQLPALLQSGVTVVVSPLISLMVDQVRQLKVKGVKSVTALNSFMEVKERAAVLNSLPNYRLIYLSPEILQNSRVAAKLKELHVNLFVIDEAHCISQWGHEFRTDYLKLNEMIKELGDPPVLALSATATPEVQQDIKIQLNRPHMVPHIYKMDKPNMSFEVEYLEDPGEKIERIKTILSNQPAPTMIYFSSRSAAEKVAEELWLTMDQRVAFYHGGMENIDRLLVQQQFMNDELDVVCCTSAFGMGVDKPNIRRIIHYHFPGQIESFIQEIGRAGRDGKPCASLVLHTHRDHYLPQLLIEKELPKNEDAARVFHWFDRNERLLSDEEMLETLQLSDSQWNFIKFHLGKSGVITRNNIEIKENWKVIQAELLNRLQERWNYKNSKYKQMINWLFYDGCRRKMLYSPFQSEVRSPQAGCCDYCGSFMKDLHIPQKEVSRAQYSSWEARLRAIFLQEPSDG